MVGTVFMGLSHMWQYSIEKVMSDLTLSEIGCVVAIVL